VTGGGDAGCSFATSDLKRFVFVFGRFFLRFALGLVGTTRVGDGRASGSVSGNGWTNAKFEDVSSVAICSRFAFGDDLVFAIDPPATLRAFGASFDGDHIEVDAFRFAVNSDLDNAFGLALVDAVGFAFADDLALEASFAFGEDEDEEDFAGFFGDIGLGSMSGRLLTDMDLEGWGMSHLKLRTTDGGQ